MKVKCIRCGYDVLVPDFSEEQMLEILGLVSQDLKLFAIKKIKDDFGISYSDAKGIVDHLNKEYGKCNRCNYDNLQGECVECPKCKAFNFNFKISSSFDQEFCTNLEWKFDFDKMEDERVKGFWCDGIDHFPEDFMSLAKSNIKKERRIKTKAWIGKDGQDVYDLTIHLGDKSIANYISGQSLIECIPADNFNKWIAIDAENLSMEVQLL
jgi:hypothetical protein